MPEMLIAVRSGYVDDDGLHEIVAGKTRIAPEVLERPGYEEFFEPGVSVRGTDSTRCEGRAMFQGHVVAIPV